MNEQPQNPQLMNYNLLNPPPTEDFNKYIQNMGQLIEDVCLSCAGQRRMIDAEGHDIIIEIKEARLCNDTGIEYIRGRLLTYLNPNNYMAQYDKATIKNIYDSEISGIIDNLFLNMERFDTDSNRIDIIEMIVCPAIWAALNKALTDKEAAYRGISSRYSNASTDENNNRGGMLGGLIR